MSKNREKHFPLFWILYALFIVAFAVFWFELIKYVKNQLVVYEAAQPKYVVEKAINDLEFSNFAGLEFEKVGSRFENPDYYRDTYVSSLKGRTLTYEESATSFDTKSPVYNIYAGDEHVADITLHETSSEQLMFILSIQQWEIKEIKPVYSTISREVTVTVPSNCKVFVNGLELSEAELTDKSREYSGFDYVKKYVTMPCEVTYHVTGLVTEPVVAIRDAYGNDVTASVDGSTYRVLLEDVAKPSEIPSDIADMVLKNAKDWTNFFSTDLEGCRSSVACLAHMFPEDSDYLTLANNYRKHDMWMYSKHDTPEFVGEKLSNYIVYSDDCFSVDVYFEKKMFLVKTKANRVDVTNATHYYVKIDGKWVIADMLDIISGE